MQDWPSVSQPGPLGLTPGVTSSTELGGGAVPHFADAGVGYACLAPSFAAEAGQAPQHPSYNAAKEGG